MSTALTGEGDGGAGAGAGGKEGAAGAGGAGAGAGGTPPWKIPELPDNWSDSLPDDLKSDQSLKQYKDFPTLVKTMLHAQKAIGADKIVVPSKHATEADWKEVYKKLGVVPESLEKYDVKVPEVFKADAEVIDKLKAAAFEANVSPKQFQKLVDLYGENLKDLIGKQQTLAKQAQEEGVIGLKAEWGKAYDQNLAKAVAAVKKFGDDGLNKLLDSTGLGNHPAVIKAFAKMGEALKDDSLLGHGSGSSDVVLAPAQAQTKYKQIMGDPNHPFNVYSHPNHSAAVQEVQELFKQAFPG